MKDANMLKLLAVLAVASMGMTAVMAMPWQFYFTQPGNSDTFGEFPGVDNETVAEMQQIYEQVQAAVEAGNYTQWREAMEGLLTENMFQRHVDFYNARQERAQLAEQLRTAWEEGDYETIAELREQMQDMGAKQHPKFNATGNESCNGECRGRDPDFVPPGLANGRGRGNAWGRLKQAFGKLKFWGRG